MRRAVAICLCLFGLEVVSLSAQTSDKNKVILSDPHADLCRNAGRKIEYGLPEGWNLDLESCKTYGLCAALAPNGKTMSSSDRFITIIFQKRDQANPQFATLQQYVRGSLAFITSKYPSVSTAAWRPSKLDSAKLTYLSGSLSEGEQGPSPCLYLWLDAGDGFYTVQAAASSREDLNDLVFDAFFNSLRLAQENGQIQKQELPAPAEGYSWTKLDEINAMVLAPKEWHLKRVSGKPTLAYFVTHENIDKEGRYITGFTIQAMRPPQPHSGEELAKSMIAGAEQKKILIGSGKTTRGVFESYWLEYRTQSKDGVISRVHALIICNTKTKTFYFCLFESPESKWEESWKIGERIIQTMILSDDI